ncbi:phosphoadenosine phosphosulfate reductase family protein [Bacillus cereus]|uniref:phosphoadenosine phosphosulfate reductase domain-containing protein n=1 Tax=Bacillus cereus TaxID=1396 RepID=UPI00192657CF|nr:phosphoadenosine phosphosulfate reductase family protein [Bacillus cereus]MBL3881624.1 phosphoadenosine phosphosulfate reductase family protein [Bacillus cereus]HDR8481089.1 phosphoadenosine phosphosulfate reductase family protein [Bacillus cereus]
MTEIYTQIKEEMKKVYLSRNCCFVGYSGGKDSSAMLTLLWDAIAELPKEERTKPIHILTSEVGVETPAMTAYISRTLQKIQENAEKQNLPFVVHSVQPSMKESYWYKVIGRGVLPPSGNSRLRWCTDSLKVKPMQRKMKEILIESQTTNLVECFDEYDDVLMLAVRNEESARRKHSIQKYEISNESLFSRHNDMKNILCFNPVKFLTGDEVWMLLLDRGILPFGVDVEEMSIQYGQAMFECGIKTGGKQQGNACGAANSRSGCWTCLMMNGEDKMLTQLISEGYTDYAYLQSWKSFLQSIRNDIRYRNVMNRRSLQTLLRNENKGNSDLFSIHNSIENNYIMFDRTEMGDYAPGGLTVEGRRILLEYLLYTQQVMNTSLISEEEIEAVLQGWYDTDGIRVYRDELEPIHHACLGELVFKPDCTINEEKTTSPFPVFFVEIDIHLGKQDLFRWIKERQRITQHSFFFFPSNYSSDSAKLTWNKLTFVVSRMDITNARDAERVARTWLGMDMYHGKTEKQHKQLLIQLLIQAMQDKPLFEKEESSTKLLYTAEFTNRLSRLLETEELLSEETNHLFAKILKKLANETFLIA